MKWARFPIPDANDLARKYVLKCLSMGAGRRTLSSELLARLRRASGDVFLIADDTIALERVKSFDYAGRYADPELEGLFGLFPINVESLPIHGLVEFVQNYVRTVERGIALFEDLFRDKCNEYPLILASRHVFCRNEVYHVVTNQDTTSEFIQASIQEASSAKWSIGCCASGVVVPEDGQISAELMSHIVKQTTHVIAEALDGEGYLMWSLN